MKLRSITARIFETLGVLLSVCAVFAVLYYWDPTRALIKRYAPGAGQKLEQLPDVANGFDAKALLTVTSAEIASTRRGLLRQRIFGSVDLPTDVLPQRVYKDVDKDPGKVHTCLSPTGPDVVHLLSRRDTIIMRAIGCESEFYRGWDNLAGIDELTGYLMKNWRPFSAAGRGGQLCLTATGVQIRRHGWRFVGGMGDVGRRRA
tara:strand:- start:459 stop:1067 length:609 start_codon:yes stop_codon:yes gene_type:complete